MKKYPLEYYIANLPKGMAELTYRIYVLDHSVRHVAKDVGYPEDAVEILATSGYMRACDAKDTDDLMQFDKDESVYAQRQRDLSDETIKETADKIIEEGLNHD